MKKNDTEVLNKIIDLLIVRSGGSIKDPKTEEIRDKIFKSVKGKKERVKEIKSITDPLDFF